MTRVAILDDYQNVALQLADWSTLPASVELTVFSDHLDEGAALRQRLQDFEIICAMRERTPFPRSLLQQLPQLKLLITAGMKNASIDIAAAQTLGITVCGTQSPGHATAELAWGLILSLLRQIPLENKNTRAGCWQTTLGHDLHGATLGVIGLGRLGSKVATVGQAFGMQVIAWSENLTAERAAECGVSKVTKQDLLQQADAISIHLRLSERSHHLIGAAELALMKPSAYIVNTSRGPIIDESALYQALSKQQIAGAGIDVFSTEPLPADAPILGLENVIITPHLGFVTEETYRVFYGQMVAAIGSYLAGDPIRVLSV